MKLYGSLSRLVAILFRQDSQDITLRPNQSTTYSAARDIQLPPGDSAHVLMSAASTATMTNKSFDANGTGNSLSNVDVADLSAAFLLSIAKGGTNSSTSLTNNRVMQSSAGAIVEAAAITAARALISDSNGIPTHSAVTATELGYVSSVTSAIQTQIDGKVAKAGDSMTGNLVLANQKEVRFSEASGSGTNYTGIKAAPTIASDHTYTLPAAFPGSSGYHLASDTSGTLSWAPASTVSSNKADWLTADGTTKVVTHSLGSTDVMVQVFDADDGSSIEVNSIIRTDTNTVTLSASEAPATSWRVLILAI